MEKSTNIHDFQGNFIAQEYLPDAISGLNFIEPGTSPKEKEVLDALHIKFNGKYKK